MWKRSERKRGLGIRRAWKQVTTVCAVALLGVPLLAQQKAQERPAATMEGKVRTACLGCHTAAIITQQQLDRRTWAKEVDKMIRWGAPVAAEDRDALIDYFAERYGPRAIEATPPVLPEGPGADKVRAACLGCHDTGVIAQEHLDRQAWEGVLDRMIRWGTPVRAEDREAIVNYLATHFAPAKKTANPEKPK